MHRRSLFAAASALLLPASARAQLSPLVGVLTLSNSSFVDPFLRDMGRLGWEHGRTFRMQHMAWEDDIARLPALAAELVRQGPKVIVAIGNPAVEAVQKATREVAIVGLANDLVAGGLVPSMARPGGNTTGVAIMAHELDVKRLAMLHDIVPKARRIALLYDKAAGAKGTLEECTRGAQQLGVQPVPEPAATREQLATILDRLPAQDVQAVAVMASPFLNGERALLIEALAKLRLPAIYQWPETAEEGGLVGYGPRLLLCYRHVTVLVNRILRGARPADLPVEQPSTFTLAINAKTARALGLTLPETVLLRADLVVD